MEEPPKWRKVVFVVFIALIIFAGIFFALRYFGKSLGLSTGSQKKVDYVIPGVPYIGIYNHTGKYSVLDFSTAPAVASVMDYWYPGEKNYSDINKYFNDISDANETVGAHNISQIFTEDGKYSVKEEIFQLDDLKKYINADTRTPLLASFKIDANQPIDVPYPPLVVIIGVKESEQKLILHDVWLGNNFEMSFDEYNQRQAQLPPAKRYNFLVVQPTDLKNKLNEVKSRSFSGYPARTATMQNAENMFKDYAIGWGAEKAGQADIAVEYFLEVRNDSNYDRYFPLALKAYLAAHLAEVYLQKKDFDNATKYIAESVSLDHDLDKPLNDWPGYELGSNAPGHFGEITLTYQVQGDIYLATGDFGKAQESYSAALVIKPDDPRAKAGLAAAEAALTKK